MKSKLLSAYFAKWRKFHASWVRKRPPILCIFFPTASLGREADAAGIAALFFFCCFFHPGLKSIAAKKPLRNSR